MGTKVIKDTKDTKDTKDIKDNKDSRDRGNRQGEGCRMSGAGEGGEGGAEEGGGEGRRLHHLHLAGHEDMRLDLDVRVLDNVVVFERDATFAPQNT